MVFDDSGAREELREAVRRVHDLASAHWAGPVLRAHEQWLRDLDAWEGGPPPAPPSGWVVK